MPAESPEEICDLFKQYMAAGDVESLLNIYDAEAVFLSQSRELKKGRQGLRKELTDFAAAKAIFDFNIKQVIQSGDIAPMHTLWTVSSPQPMTVYALEVARRQPDGTCAGLSVIPLPSACRMPVRQKPHSGWICGGSVSVSANGYAVLTSGNRPDDNKRFLPGCNGVGERGVGWMVGDVFFTGKKA